MNTKDAIFRNIVICNLIMAATPNPGADDPVSKKMIILLRDYLSALGREIRPADESYRSVIESRAWRKIREVLSGPPATEYGHTELYKRRHPELEKEYRKYIENGSGRKLSWDEFLIYKLIYSENLAPPGKFYEAQGEAKKLFETATKP